MLTIVILSVLLIISIGFNIYGILILSKMIDKLDEYDIFIQEYKLLVENTYKRLKIIDEKQIFEKDDDVGFVFQNIIKLIEKLKI